jgi:hypothetical protein
MENWRSQTLNETARFNFFTNFDVLFLAVSPLPFSFSLSLKISSSSSDLGEEIVVSFFSIVGCGCDIVSFRGRLMLVSSVS